MVSINLKKYPIHDTCGWIELSIHVPVVGDGCPVVWLLKKVLPAKIHFLTFDLLFLLLTCFALLGFL